jgi:hypothetical protein
MNLLNPHSLGWLSCKNLIKLQYKKRKLDKFNLGSPAKESVTICKITCAPALQFASLPQFEMLKSVYIH